MCKVSSDTKKKAEIASNGFILFHHIARVLFVFIFDKRVFILKLSSHVIPKTSANSHCNE